MRQTAADTPASTFTRNEEAARRLLNLVFTLSIAGEPLSTEQIISDPEIGYASPSRDSRIRAFNRDRDTLAELGIFIREHAVGNDRKNEQRLWSIDRSLTHASASDLSPYDAEEALTAIDQVFSLHADDPSRWPLQLARTKLCKAAGLDPEGSGAARSDHHRNLTDLWSAFARRRPAVFSYRDARGEECEHTVDLYGMFERGSSMYLVGRDHGVDALRTFRTDRVTGSKTAPNSSKPYSIPEAFDISGFQFLPFDFSSADPIDATLSFDPGVGTYEIELLTKNRGVIAEQEDGTRLWTIEVRDLDAAAKFAIEHQSTGLRAVGPEPLIKRILARKQQAVQAHVS